MAGTRSPRRARLQELLSDELTRVLTADGWAVDPAQDCGPDSTGIAAFRRPVAPDFAAAVSFGRPSSLLAESSLTAYAEIGASYEPLYRLWPLLTDRIPLGEVRFHAQILDDIEVDGEHDVPGIARQLADTVPVQAIYLTQRHASVEAVLTANRGDPDQLHQEIQVVPALLAAAGRGPEALAALAEYRGMDAPETSERSFRRFAYLLTRWLDAGAVLPDPPTAPPTRIRIGSAPSMRQIWNESRNRSDAIEAAKLAAPGTTRAELRALLKRELDSRGVVVSPLDIESIVDGIQVLQQPHGQVRSAVRVLQGLGELGTSMFRTINAVKSTGFEHPMLEPPDHALYPARWAIDRWIAVDIDADAWPWLARVAAAATFRVGNTVLVDAWLDWDVPPTDVGARITVHIGARRVGTLDPAASRPYRPIMADAARRGEHPFLRAQLADNQGRPSLLQIVTPPVASDVDG